MRRYLPYGDSPTIRSYTRWEKFEEALKSPGSVVVYGAEAGTVKGIEDDLWWTGEHFKRAKGFTAVEKEIKIRSEGGMGFAHVEIPLEGKIVVFEDSSTLPLSVSGRIKGNGEVLHVVRGEHPHFSLWEIEGNVTVRTLVEGVDAFLRYRGKGNIQAFGMSIGKRSDVYHVFEAKNSSVVNRHLLIGKSSSFLVHRPLARVFEGGDAFLETLLVKKGGFVVGVPSVEVYSSSARGARHSVKDLIPSEEQMFYLRSRGFSREEAEKYLVEEAVKFLLGDLLEVGVALP